jgi:hypothetical protein
VSPRQHIHVHVVHWQLCILYCATLYNSDLIVLMFRFMLPLQGPAPMCMLHSLLTLLMAQQLQPRSQVTPQLLMHSKGRARCLGLQVRLAEQSGYC